MERADRFITVVTSDHPISAYAGAVGPGSSRAGCEMRFRTLNLSEVSENGGKLS
jgi:hypothetical protein